MVKYKMLSDEDKINVIRQFMLNNGEAFVVANNMDVETFNMLVFLYYYNYIKDSDLATVYNLDADPIDQLKFISDIHNMYSLITTENKEMMTLTYDAYMEHLQDDLIGPALQESFDYKIPFMMITKSLSEMYKIMSKITRTDYSSMKEENIEKIASLVYSNDINMDVFKPIMINNFNDGIKYIREIFTILDLYKKQFDDISLSKIISFESDDVIMKRLKLSSLSPNNNILYYYKPVKKEIITIESTTDAMPRFNITDPTDIRENIETHQWEINTNDPGYSTVPDFSGTRLERMTSVLTSYRGDIQAIISNLIGFEYTNIDDSYVYTLNKSDIMSVILEEYEYIGFPFVSRVTIDNDMSYMYGVLVFGLDEKTNLIYPYIDLNIVYTDTEEYTALMKLTPQEQYKKVKLEAKKMLISVQNVANNGGIHDLVVTDGKQTINGINVDIKFTNNKFKRVTFDMIFSADGFEMYGDKVEIAFPPISPLVERFVEEGHKLEYSDQPGWKIVEGSDIRNVTALVDVINDEVRETIFTNKKFTFSDTSNVFIDTLFTFLKADIYDFLYNAHRDYLTYTKVNSGISYIVDNTCYLATKDGVYENLIQEDNHIKRDSYEENLSVKIASNILINKDLEAFVSECNELRNNFTAI